MPAAANEVIRYTSGLTLLCVDDNGSCLEQVWLISRGWFDRVITAQNGMQGLELARSARPDLILTDHVMPVMSGLQMARELRDLGDRTPLILMTAEIDNGTLGEAIDLGFSRFLPKPVSASTLASAFTAVAREIVADKLREEARSQELELLRFKEQYHYRQQELASRKEKYLLRNDLRHKSVCCAEGENDGCWFVDIGYRPQQVMCGDGFMVRHLSDGNILLFIVDAMGSGLSASLTAMCATAYLNHLVDLHEKEGRYDFQRLVRLFVLFSRTILLPEELLSCGFLQLDCCGGALDVVLFALPPLLVRAADGSVTRVKGNNPPLSRYTNDHRSQRVELAGVDALLVTTDGLTDAETREGGNYRQWIAEDFARSFFARDLERFFLERISDGFDDVTFLTLTRIDAGDRAAKRLQVAPRLDEVARAVEWVEAYCWELRGVGPDFLEETAVLATEALMNAFEHGCLGLSEKAKAELLAKGSYHEVIAGAAPEGAIFLELAVRRLGETRILVLTVTDSGAGFDLSRLDAKKTDGKALCGRGLGLIRKYSDGMWYNRQGNRLCIMKRINRGE